jgi:hypothetical protein
VTRISWPRGAIRGAWHFPLELKHLNGEFIGIEVINLVIFGDFSGHEKVCDLFVSVWNFTDKK